MFLPKPLATAVLSGLIWGTKAYSLLCNESDWGRITDFSWLCFILMLYFSSGMLGLFLGMADFFHPLRSGSEVWYSFTEMPLSFWWGITFTPFLWTLFLFAFGNLELVKYLVRKSTA